jgi:hypothetical protein
MDLQLMQQVLSNRFLQIFVITYNDRILNILVSFWTLSIVRISTNQKTQRFGNWIFFRLQARGGTYSTEKPKACLSTGDARTKVGQPLETRGL